jgi:Spy/CpxP family protein refolding chaperone
MQGLSDEQRKKIDTMHEDLYKNKMAIRDKIRDAKVELAKEITKDSPQQKDIDNKIDAILKLKREKMQLKAAHKIDVRKVLNKEQRAKFDEHVMNKAKYGRKGRGGHGYHHHE